MYLSAMFLMAGGNGEKGKSVPELKQPVSAGSIHWQNLVLAHVQRYPKMQIEDVYKLLHQATMGSEHAVKNRQSAFDWMQREIANLSPGAKETLVDTLGENGRFARIHLRPYLLQGYDPGKLVEVFLETANRAKPDEWQLSLALSTVQKMAGDGSVPWRPAALDSAFRRLTDRHFPAVHHSEEYRRQYKPAYRVVLIELLGKLFNDQDEPAK